MVWWWFTRQRKRWKCFGCISNSHICPPSRYGDSVSNFPHQVSADAGAAKLTGNPRALARALQRLESTARQMPLNANAAFEPLLIIHPISGQFLGNLFSSHPATEDRIQALLKLES